MSTKNGLGPERDALQVNTNAGGVFLTFPPLPLLQDGLQPRLLLLRGLGHADEPLVLGRVVDLPAVVHDVPAAVVVSCEAQKPSGQF